MNFNEFIRKSDLEVQKFIKVKDCFDLEKVSEKDDTDFFTTIYFVRSNVTKNIFIVRYFYNIEDNEFDESYVVLREGDSKKFVEFFNS